MKIVYGYDIGSYATNPNHEKLVKQVYESIARHGIENYFIKYCSKSPVTVEMVYNSSQKYDVDPIMVAAIMQVDSNMGAKGLGSKTHNPGNVQNDDSGHIKDWGTWEAGVDAVSKNLAWRKVK